MSIRAQFANAAEIIMKQAGDVPIDITYNSYTEGADDGMGGASDGTFTSETVQAFVYSFTQKQIAESGLVISPGDQKVIIEQAVLSALDITVGTKDEMVINSNTYKIIPEVGEDPASAVYFFHMRQK